MPRKRIEKLPPNIKRKTEKQLLKIAKKIQKRRKSMKMSQETLAEVLDIGVSTLKSIEQGKRLPSLSMLLYICHVLNFKISIG